MTNRIRYRRFRRPAPGRWGFEYCAEFVRSSRVSRSPDGSTLSSGFAGFAGLNITSLRAFSPPPVPHSHHACVKLPSPTRLYYLRLVIIVAVPPGNRYRHRLTLLKGGKSQEQKGLDLDRRVLRLLRAASWAIQV